MSEPVHFVCPCCGQALPDFPSAAELAVAAKLSPSEATILDVLASRSGRYVSFDAILDALYGDDPSGGPDSGPLIIRVMIHKLRRKIKGVNIMICNQSVAIVADLSANGPGSIGGGLGYRVHGVRR